ncbi:MAG: hypothetical protein LBI18_04175 [Planctomycetaceae bacterium]|nr:hypothetical protein [Planctomycetaceae bacterium]
MDSFSSGAWRVGGGEFASDNRDWLVGTRLALHSPHYPLSTVHFQLIW